MVVGGLITDVVFASKFWNGLLGNGDHLKGVDLAGEVCTVFESVSQCPTGDPVKWENTALVRLIIVIDY